MLEGDTNNVVETKRRNVKLTEHEFNADGIR